MADHTQTITNSLTPVGIGEVNIWGTMDWNDHWGSMSDAWQDVGKGLDMADLTLTMALGQDVTHILGGNALTLGSTVEKSVTISPINDSITATEDLDDITKSLADWDYVFTKPDTDGLNKKVDNWEKI